MDWRIFPPVQPHSGMHSTATLPTPSQNIYLNNTIHKRKKMYITLSHSTCTQYMNPHFQSLSPFLSLSLSLIHTHTHNQTRFCRSPMPLKLLPGFELFIFCIAACRWSCCQFSSNYKGRASSTSTSTNTYTTQFVFIINFKHFVSVAANATSTAAAAGGGAAGCGCGCTTTNNNNNKNATKSFCNPIVCHPPIQRARNK